MILIGQYDSPFVRRVGIALCLYEMAFEHWPWSSFADAERLRQYNPLTRVPTLVLDTGEVLVDSHAMLDYLDHQVTDDRILLPRQNPMRYQALRIATLATGLADKAVSLFYEKRLHTATSDVWVQRCTAQIQATLALLEKERQTHMGNYWFDGRLGHADIALTCALRFMTEAHPALLNMAHYPTLHRDAERLEATPVFQRIAQVFVPPA